MTARHCSVPLPLVLAFASLALGCKAKALVLTEPFADNFDRDAVGSDWNNTGAEYKTTQGKLSIAKAHNHPLWLRRKLPFSVVVELDATSNSPDGDLKIELMGDGESFDADQGRYDPTGYMFVFGGWQNQMSIIGKLGEHDAAVKASRTSPKVEPGRTYHWTIIKRGGFIDWKIDGQPFLQVFDPQPLGGPGHEFFAINNWETDVSYDNLRIRPAN